MAIINQALQELKITIVYCGPPLVGKSTNLNQLRECISPFFGEKGETRTLFTGQDRITYFEFLPAKGLFGYKTTEEIRTIGGEVADSQSWRIALRGVDGIVFVADSQIKRMADNRKCLFTLYDDLYAIGLDPRKIPLVFQYNKRDLKDAAEIKDLEANLNFSEPHCLFFEAEAHNRFGVLEAYNTLLTLVAEKINV